MAARSSRYHQIIDHGLKVHPPGLRAQLWTLLQECKTTGRAIKTKFFSKRARVATVVVDGVLTTFVIAPACVWKRVETRTSNGDTLAELVTDDTRAQKVRALVGAPMADPLVGGEEGEEEGGEDAAPSTARNDGVELSAKDVGYLFEITAHHRATYDRIAAELKGMTREELFADIDRSTAFAKRHYDEVCAHVKVVDKLCEDLETLASDMKRTHEARAQLLVRINRLLAHRTE